MVVILGIFFITIFRFLAFNAMSVLGNQKNYGWQTMNLLLERALFF